jgi:hypothetical protein
MLVTWEPNVNDLRNLVKPFPCYDVPNGLPIVPKKGSKFESESRIVSYSVIISTWDLSGCSPL